MFDMTNIVLGWPVDPSTPITQLFGDNPSDYARFGQAGHNGVDFGCPLGTPIRAAAEGIVLSAALDKTGYGNYIKIEHGDFQTLYGHMSQMLKKTGQSVSKGEIIGYSGSTGNSTGPHLHFELRIPGAILRGYPQGARDPMPFMEAISGQPSAISEEPSASTLFPTVGEGSKVKLKAGNDYVNIRNGPGLEYAVVGKLLPGDTEKIVLEVSGEWACLLKWEGCTLWCHTGYLEVNGNLTG